MVLVHTNRNRETVERLGNLNIFPGRTTAKTMRTWLEGRIRVFENRGNEELVQIIRGIQRAYETYHPRKEVEVEVEGWKGNSSIKIIKGIDKLTVIKYQRKDKLSRPTEVIYEFSSYEVKAILWAIEWNNYLEAIPTRDIARRYCYHLRLSTNSKGEALFEDTNELSGEFDWDRFFSWRKEHNRLTVLLSSLDKLEIIEYVGGKTKVKKLDTTIKDILK